MTLFFVFVQVSKLLLARGSNPDSEGKNGVTPLHVAAHYDHQNVALLLLDKASITCTNYYKKVMISDVKITDAPTYLYLHLVL